MEISNESLEEFKRLYREEFGEELSDREALEIAQRLLGFVMLVCRPLPKNSQISEQNNAIEF